LKTQKQKAIDEARLLIKVGYFVFESSKAREWLETNKKEK